MIEVQLILQIFVNLYEAAHEGISADKRVLMTLLLIEHVTIYALTVFRKWELARYGV